MIEYIRGELTELTPALAVVEAFGVGYALNISLNTYTAIQGKRRFGSLLKNVLWQEAVMIALPFMALLQSRNGLYTVCSYLLVG